MSRLDRAMSPGSGAEKLFRETLKQVGNFRYVVSTKIDKRTADRPHFFLAYGTKDSAGLKAFRDVEYKALREHAKNRATAKELEREVRTQTRDLFAGIQVDAQEDSIDELVAEQKSRAMDHLGELLSHRTSMKFSDVVDALLPMFVLRETNVKDVCAYLAKNGVIENTWGGGNRKPVDGTIIKRR